LKLLKILKSQKGAVAMLLAAALPAFIGIGALALDMGQIYVNRAQLSTATDAAALAGAQELPRFPEDALSGAIDYGTRNGATLAAADILIGGTNNDTITVKASREVPLTFARVFGMETITVSASATAKVSVAKSVPWIVPFVLPKTQSFDYDKQFTMRMYGKDNPYMKATDDPSLQMDYMNVGIENTNISQYIQYLKYGYQKTFTVGNDMQYLAPSSGGQASVDAFYDRTVRDTNTDIDEAKIGDPRIMLIPLVETMLPRTTREGTKMKIVGFVGFFLDEVHREYGTKFWAKGRFIKDLNVGAGESTEDSAADFGVRTTKLVK
jgi:Flp pilus assembly protein TadG